MSRENPPAFAVLWAPWRIRYIEVAKKAEGCIFCDLPRENDDEKNLILARLPKAFAIMNNYPYNPGHTMIAPYRHVAGSGNLAQVRPYVVPLGRHDLVDGLDEGL